MATEAMTERSEAVNSSRKDRPVSPGGRNVVAIDIGKKRHAAAGLTAAGEPAGPKLSFANDRAGVDRLEEDLFILCSLSILSIPVGCLRGSREGCHTGASGSIPVVRGSRDRVR